jgi:hypothetical protein
MAYDITKLITQYMISIPPGKFPNGGIPSGHLFAHLMQHGVDLDTHVKLVGALSDARVCKGTPYIEVSNFYITLTPRGEEVQAQFLKILGA